MKLTIQSFVIRPRCFSASRNTYATGGFEDRVSDITRTRNIGIIAHIDAGKTTTTERMLYYAGFTRRIGDVDDGSTVTDFLPAERARGITIQAAAITFSWPPGRQEESTLAPSQGASTCNQQLSTSSHNINLIDTPGHADFTFEVRRSLRILDGAICILDGVAGVEAQTEQVWKQAGEWQIPRIVYVNKLDRDGAAFGRAVKEVGSRLGGWPAVCQIPWWEDGKGQFTGVGDVVNLQGLKYDPRGEGKDFIAYDMQALEKTVPYLAKEVRRARVHLVELLSEHDEAMVDNFLTANEDHNAITPLQILASLRRCLLSDGGCIIPLFAGASFRNIGIQPLLDAVVNLLPDPTERPDAEISLGNAKGTLGGLFAGHLVVRNDVTGVVKSRKKGAATPSVPLAQSLDACALAFKVVSDQQRGVLVYVRVYSGSIKRNALLYNTNLNVSERAPTLLRMYASDSVAVQSIDAGQIGVIAGLRYARTGDTLIAYPGNKAAPPEPLNMLQLRPIEVPPPVFFASIEPNSLREEKDMHDKLALLLREDPSLHVTQDEDTGQTLLSGMGELHLEIARDRLVNDLKAKATMGKIEIGYRETILQASSSVTKIFDRKTAGNIGKAGCTGFVQPFNAGVDTPFKPDFGEANFFSTERDGNMITILAPSLDQRGRPRSSDDAALPPQLSLVEIQSSYLTGALAALSRGPVHSYPVCNVHLTLTMEPAEHTFGIETTPSSLSSAARIATIAALQDASAKETSVLMEPIMNAIISVSESSLGNVINDVSSSRGGHVLSLDDEGDEERPTSQRGVKEDQPTIDVDKIYAPPDPYESSLGTGRATAFSNRLKNITAKVPLKEMVGYLKHLRSITGGRGTFVMSVDRFERMNPQRERSILSELRRGV